MEQIRDIIGNFMKYREENAIALNWDADPEILKALWRYYRRSERSETETEAETETTIVKLPFTAREKTDAVECHDKYPHQYDFMLPIFKAIASGSGNEGVGMFRLENGLIKVDAIIRYAPDKYHIMEFEFPASVDPYLAELLAGAGKVLLCSGIQNRP